MKSFLILIFFISFVAQAKDYKGFDIDNKSKHEKYKVKLQSGKKDDLRFYKGTLSRDFNWPIDIVLKSVTNFEDKCNNDYKDQRELTSKNKNCTYHNGNLVESKIYRKLKKFKKEEFEIDRFLVARRIYNRQEFSHVDLIQIYEKKNDKDQKVIIVKSQMLKDKQVKKYIKPPVERDSVFLQAYSEFKLTETNKGQTHLDYYYASETDHWLLNKSVSVGQVFDSMAKSIDLLFQSIDTEVAKISPKTIKSTAVAIRNH